MQNRVGRRKKAVQVSLKQEVIEYLDALAREADESRSWVVEALARQHQKLRRQRVVENLPDPAMEVIRV